MSDMQDNYYDIILTACGVKGISGSFRCVGGCVAKGGGCFTAVSYTHLTLPTTAEV